MINQFKQEIVLSCYSNELFVQCFVSDFVQNQKHMEVRNKKADNPVDSSFFCFQRQGWFPRIAGNAGNHGNEGQFHKSHQILNQTKRYINKLYLEKMSRYKTV